MEWRSDNRIQITPPNRPKKLTGTRFATILGLNPWSTPFEVWCEVTRTYEKPFEDTKYTIAGKTIEPKQADYMMNEYFLSGLVRPSDVYGNDYFKVTRGDFFPNVKILGGMWDYLNTDVHGNVLSVLEMKTTKRAEYWLNNVPEYYALQASLYAYLSGCDNVMMVASFLEESDYDNPEAFIPSQNNTIVHSFKVSERYPRFKADYVLPALNWWEQYVLSGISPVYDEKKDADVLKALRTTTVDTNTSDLETLISEAENLKADIDRNAEIMKAKETRYKVITDALKNIASEKFSDAGIKTVNLTGDNYTWTVSKSNGGKELDINALKADGLYEKYLTDKTPTIRMTVSVNKKG